MGESQTETDDREVERESQVHDQAAALSSEVRELREGYERLVARIDAALAAGETGEAPDVASDQGGAVSGVEVYMLNLAASGYTRDETAGLLAEQFGERDDELLDKVFASAPISEPPRRGRFRRRP